MNNILKGTLEQIIYQKDDFIVGIVGRTKVCGRLPGAKTGLKLTLFGRMQTHERYGEQYIFNSYKIHDGDSYHYLTSGLIRHVGPVTARELVQRFSDPITAALNTPLALTAVKGISIQKAHEISQSIRETLQYRQIAADLAPCGFTPGTLIKIYHQLEDYRQVLINPYILVKVNLIGFKKADAVAFKLGIAPDSKFRIKAAAYYEMEQSAQEGHVFLPEKDLAVRVYNLLGRKIPPAFIEKNIAELDLPREGSNLYLPRLLKAENFVASYFLNLKEQKKVDVSKHIQNYNIKLSELQQKAVALAFNTNAMVLTGGPGTGKTETIKAITNIYKQVFPQEQIILAAPTGRASRRMAEVTDLKAQTIHSLIASKKKIDAGLVVIDETSMVDIELLARLLSLINNARLIFVGDPDQLPSVGPGQVLRDLADCLPTVRLQQIFRQAEESDIIVNAHRINSGSINLRLGKDFYFVHKELPEEIHTAVMSYVAEYYRKKKTLNGLQLLSFMKKGTLGTEKLNRDIQALMTSEEADFKKGDRVIQLVNNYQKNVFNGDIGIIKSVNPFIVSYRDRDVEYKNYELDQLALGYCITAHKSQGSEFPVVVIPLHTQHYIMLSRQVLYTAVTRASKQVVLIGSYRALSLAVGNTSFARRNSALRDKILTRTLSQVPAVHRL